MTRATTNESSPTDPMPHEHANPPEVPAPRVRRRWRAAVIVATVVVVPVLIQMSSAFQVDRAQAKRLSLGDELYVEATGPLGGTSMVFLPGMMGTTTYWTEGGVLSLAGEQTRVLLLDELGFGRSPWPDVAYTLDDHLGAIERTLHAAQADGDLILVGHSFGALLAAEYGARHASSVRQVILLGTPLYRNEAEAQERVGEMSLLAGLTARGSPLARVLCALHTALLPLTVRLAPLFQDELPPPVAADAALHFWPSMRGSVENVVLGHSIEPALAALGDKVTFVHGRRDEITPLARVKEVAAASGASVVVTDDDHLSYWHHAGPLIGRLTGHPL